MKLNRLILQQMWSARIRLWRYFRDGYGIYVTKPLGIMNFLTITFYILMDKIPSLKTFFPHFYLFAVIALLGIVPLSIGFGWWHMRQSKIFGTEAILGVESNPQAAHINRVSMDNSLLVFEALNIKPSVEWLRLYEYWKRLDEKWKWKP